MIKITYLVNLAIAIVINAYKNTMQVTKGA